MGVGQAASGQPFSRASGWVATGRRGTSGGGAKDGGGTTLGILPGLDRADANPYVALAARKSLHLTQSAHVPS